MASCTMVNSRCVAGLSTGIRAFSAMATMINANSASPSDTLRPTSDDTRKAAMVESWVEPASSAHGHKESGVARELGRAGEQRDRKHHHDHGGLRERGDHHLAAGADAAEAGAETQPGPPPGEGGAGGEC